jgi:hypothetical protein
MVLASSIVGVTLGAAIACVAGRYPRHRGLIETVAGVLLLGGFGLLGYLLGGIFGKP